MTFEVVNVGVPKAIPSPAARVIDKHGLNEHAHLVCRVAADDGVDLGGERDEVKGLFYAV